MRRLNAPQRPYLPAGVTDQQISRPKVCLLRRCRAKRANVGDEPLKIGALDLVTKGGHGSSADANHLGDFFIASALLPLSAAEIGHRRWRLRPISCALSAMAARARHAVECGDGTRTRHLRGLRLGSGSPVRGDLVGAGSRMGVIAGAPRTRGCLRPTTSDDKGEKPYTRSNGLPVHAPILAAVEGGINPKGVKTSI